MNLNEKQNKVLLEIEKFVNKNKNSPTVRELMTILDYKSTCSVFRLLKQLEKKGYIKRNANKQRNITLLTHNKLNQENSFNLPLINNNLLTIPSVKNKNLFGYRISNNYFNYLQIKKGDYLILEKIEKLNTNDLGLFIIDQKYRIMIYEVVDNFYKLTDKETIYLNNVYIVGKVIGLYRKNI